MSERKPGQEMIIIPVGRMGALAAVWLTDHGATIERLDFSEIALVQVPPEHLTIEVSELTFTIRGAKDPESSIAGRLDLDVRKTEMTLCSPLPAETGTLAKLSVLTGYSSAACEAALYAVISSSQGQYYAPENIAAELPRWLQMRNNTGSPVLAVLPALIVEEFHATAQQYSAWPDAGREQIVR